MISRSQGMDTKTILIHKEGFRLIIMTEQMVSINREPMVRINREHLRNLLLLSEFHLRWQLLDEREGR